MLVMKPFVDIEGSGQQATVIQGVGNNDVDQLTAIVKGAASSELRDLQVKSVGSASQSNSISIVMTDGADTKITGVTLVSGGASGNWGLRSIGARPSLKDVTIEVQGGTNSYGIVSRGESAIPEIEQTKISVTGAQNGAGIAGASSSRLEKLRDLRINVSASSSAYGIQIIEGQDASVRLAFRRWMFKLRSAMEWSTTSLPAARRRSSRARSARTAPRASACMDWVTQR